MIDERQEELASLYALDLLEGAERAQFETALARDPALQTLVRELREAGAQLAHAAPAATPPPELKARVMKSIGGAGAPAAETGGKIIAFRFVPWAIAAGFALAAGWFGLRYLAADSEVELARNQARFAQTDLQLEKTKREREQLLASQLISDLNRQLAGSNQQLATMAQRVAQLTDEMKSQADLANLKIAALVSLNKNSPDAVAVAVWNPGRQEGVFAIDKAPALEPTQNLELWVIEDGKAPVSAGVFAPDTSGSAKVHFTTKSSVGPLATFAVSREKKDGERFHAAPSADVVMLGHGR